LYRLSYIRRDTQQLTTTTYNNNMSAGKSASRPLLPVEETIRAHALINCEIRFHAYHSGISNPVTPTTKYFERLHWRAHPRTGKLFHISAGRMYRPEKTTWTTPYSRDVVDYPFNVDWYMRERNTVANVKKFVGEFH